MRTRLSPPGGTWSLSRGHWDHEPPGPVAPHRTAARRAGDQVQLRVLFAAEPAAEAEMRRRIEAGLSRDGLAGPDGVVTHCDFKPAPNQGGHVELYEVENRAFDPDGHVLAAMRTRAPWAGRTLVDLGCGSGYWLSVYAGEAAEVIGVEPDPRLLPLAAGRDPRARVRHGSAEHIPLADQSADVVHARFAYFFPPGCEAGLAEVMRVLRPGGTLVVVGNDLRAGQFAEFVRAAQGALVPAGGPETDAWWAARGADRTTVRSEWRFQTRADLEAVLRMEFPREVADPWLGAHPGALSLGYSYALFALDKPAGLLRAGRP